VPNPIVIDGNTMTNVQQGGMKLDMSNTGSGSSAVAAKITNNTIGTDAARVGIGPGTSISVASGIIVERRKNDSPAGNVLISGNSIRNGTSGQSLSTLNAPGIFVRTKANSHLDATVTGNNVDTASSNGVAEMRFDTNANEVGDIQNPFECDDVSGNTLPAPSASAIVFNETNGTHVVEQASAGAVSTANSSAPVSAGAGVAFGTACAAPPS
jgi:hypothetical protein